MRLIATFQDQRKAILLSNYLKSQNIENECEISISTDWGDSQYGAPTCRIWVRDEEHLQEALEITRNFSENSEDPRFQPLETDQVQVHLKRERRKTSTEKDLNKPEGKQNGLESRSEWRNEPMGFVTLSLLVICSLLFFFSNMSAPVPDQEALKAKAEFLPLPALQYSTLEKNLLFDYPHAFEIVDTINEKIESELITQFNPLPKAIATLYQHYQHASYWNGYYDRILSYFDPIYASRFSADAPWFEKIQQGQLWRLISPAFLHAGYFHLFFNMIWLIILGKQLEQRIGWQRYLFFVIFAALITNTSQYLMSGFNFMGFSGVVCAMIAFVWVRQRAAPWEGYLLQTSTLNFTLIFLVSIVLLQLGSFYTEIVYKYSINPGIANTAHMMGLLVGIILGKLNVFSWKFR
ncbi:MAG: rhomboid family intramembrane serine protease [Parachlamydiaceae bacterium]|nr:rhomboid family intramembrane serine protease [Parachlamydiaceae bacterium]